MSTQRILRRAAVLLASGIIGLGSFQFAVVGCPYSIREAGFIVREPIPYKLTVFVKDDTAATEQLAQWLEVAADQYLSDSNVAAEVVNLDQEPSHPAKRYLEALALQALPVAILVSPRDKALCLRDLSLSALSAKTVQDMVRGAIVSPQRDELVARIITDWCVVIVVEGTDAVDNQRVTQAAIAAGKTVVGATTEMGEKIKRPPYVMTLSGNEPGEQVLLWSLGLDGEKTQARLAVLFGMGRRIGPVFEGAEVTKTGLSNLFRLLGRNCACTTDPSWLLGPAVPLAWGKDLELQVRDELGFDPNNPAVAGTLAGVWTSLGTGTTPPEDSSAFPPPGGFPPDAGSGYVEFSLEPQERAAPPTFAQRSAWIVLGIMVALALLALAGGAVLWLRQLNR